MNEEERKQLIQGTFDKVATVYGRGAARYFHLSGETTAGLLPLKGNESVLDVAAGTGATSLPLAKRLPHGSVTSVDFSQGMLAQLAQSAHDQGLNNIECRAADMTNMPFAPGSFDYATCSFGLFFVDDMAALLNHIASTVKPGGKVFVSGFRGDSFQPMAQLCLDRLRSYGLEVPEQFGWQRMSEPEQLHEIFSAAGLEDVHIEQRAVGYHIDAEGWWDVVWTAGFRGLVEQLGDKLEEFKQAHFEELKPLCSEEGMWLEVDVNYTCGTKSV